jgi:hypothetical protein
MPVIDFLGSGPPGPFASFAAAFRQGLSETGYIENQNVATEYRLGGGRLWPAARVGRRSRWPQGWFDRDERRQRFGTVSTSSGIVYL